MYIPNYLKDESKLLLHNGMKKSNRVTVNMKPNSCQSHTTGNCSSSKGKIQRSQGSQTELKTSVASKHSSNCWKFICRELKSLEKTVSDKATTLQNSPIVSSIYTNDMDCFKTFFPSLLSSSFMRSCFWGAAVMCTLLLLSGFFRDSGSSDRFGLTNQKLLISRTSNSSGVEDGDDDLKFFEFLKDNIVRLKGKNDDIKLLNEQLTAENSWLKEGKEVLENSVFDLQHKNADLLARKEELEKASGWLEKEIHSKTPRSKGTSTGPDTKVNEADSPISVDQLSLKSYQSTQFHWPAYEERNNTWCSTWNTEADHWSKNDLPPGQIQPVPWLEFPWKVRDEYNNFTIEPRKNLSVQYRTRLYRITPRKPTWRKGEGYGCQITLATIASLDRLTTLAETTRMWRGRVSLAIWLSVTENATDEWVLSTLRAAFYENEASTVVIFIITPLPGPDADVFPINVLRNYARFGVQGKWLYAVDADEVPNAACNLHEQWLREGIRKFPGSGGECGLTAWMTAALELTEPFRRNETIKNDLRALTRRPSLGNHITKNFAVEWLKDFHFQTFHMSIWNSYGPQLTYSKWMDAVKAYGVKWHWLAEPYTITEVPTPWCPTPFYNYGDSADKVACSYLLYASGYKLAVLPQAFTIDDLFVDIENIQTTEEGRRVRQFCWSPDGRNGENGESWCRGRRDFLFDTVAKNMGVGLQVKRKYTRASEIKLFNDIMEKSPYDMKPLPYQKRVLELGPSQDEGD